MRREKRENAQSWRKRSEALVKAVEELRGEEDTAAIIEATADLLEAVAVARGDLPPAQRFPKIDNLSATPIRYL
jgi:hypothetical protein